jgi:hypothetical protein
MNMPKIFDTAPGNEFAETLRQEETKERAAICDFRRRFGLPEHLEQLRQVARKADAGDKKSFRVICHALFLMGVPTHLVIAAKSWVEALTLIAPFTTQERSAQQVAETERVKEKQPAWQKAEAAAAAEERSHARIRFEEFRRGFRLSAKGNPWRKWEGRTVTVFENKRGWGYCISDGGAPRWSPRSYGSGEEAMHELARALGVIE